METKCRICGNTKNNNTLIAREMLLGLREEFEYFQCARCDCLQIAEFPENMAKYYPADEYYSYQKGKSYSKFRDLVHRMLFDAACKSLYPLSWRYIRVFGYSVPFLKNINKNACILDVGCGAGNLLREMSVWGYKNLTGIDPFIKKDIEYSSGIKIYKQDVIQHADLQNIKYDFIMLNHSFEHMSNPHESLPALYKMLAGNGTLLIRIPVCDSYAFRKYGKNWFQIDAPRHFFIHTKESICKLAKQHHFELQKIDCDSSERQIRCSENIEQGRKTFSYGYIPVKREKALKKFAGLLNIIGDGDQACFIFKKQE